MRLYIITLTLRSQRAARAAVLRLGLGLLALGVSITGVRPLAAQSPPRDSTDSGSPAERAGRLARQGDTTSAVALLESTVRTTLRDAAAWHPLGVLRWEQGRRGRNPTFMKDRRAVQLLVGADTALRLATQFAPDSARYWLTLARFNRQSRLSTMIFSAQQQIDAAAEVVEKSGDRPLIAQVHDETGVTHWRRYEVSANRGLVTDNQRIQLTSFNNWDRSKARDYVNSIGKKIEPPTGGSDYQAALGRFRLAVQHDSTNLRYSRHLYMALAEKRQWTELARIAEQRTRQFPLDYQAQLALGLASVRLGQMAEAQRAFDRALELMDEAERERLTRFTRILRPKPTKASKASGGDSVQFMALPGAQQRGLEQMYWYMNDPLTVTAENEYRLEFLARVVFADFRWTDEDLDARGADSDRGDIYVRYGPPDFEMTLAGDAQTSTVNLIWAYNAGFTFFFDMTPGFGTARSSFADRDAQQNIVNQVPVSWANVESDRIIDTIPVRVARFRAGRDSADAVVAATFRVDSLVRGLAVDRVPVDLDFRVFDQFVRVRGVESSQIGVAPDSAQDPIARTWTRRLGPGINVVRVEAFQGDSKRAARAMARLEPFVTAGFGMSDLLIGSRPSPRDAARPPGSWRDLEVTPSTGDLPRGAPLGLVWELYEPQSTDGASRYRVTISVQPVERRGALGFGVRVLDGLGRAIARSGERGGRFTISFDRTAPAARTIVDHLTLDLGEAPAGAYLLRVEITDSVSKRQVARETPFRIR